MERPIAALGIEPTYSARQAAALLGRSFSWPDQRVRHGDFVLPDGTVVQPLRTPGGYRRFTLEILKEIALSSYRHGWFKMDKLKCTFRELAMAVYGDTDEYQIPGWRVILMGWPSASQPANPVMRVCGFRLGEQRGNALRSTTFDHIGPGTHGY